MSSQQKVFEPVLRSGSGTGIANPAATNTKSSSQMRKSKATMSKTTLSTPGINVNAKVNKIVSKTLGQNQDNLLSPVRKLKTSASKATTQAVPLYKKQDLNKFAMPDMTNYDPDVLVSPRDTSVQNSYAIKTVFKTSKSLTKVKPKTKILSIDIEKSKEKVMKRKEQLSQVATPGPKTPKPNKSKLGGAANKTTALDKQKSTTIRRSAKKLVNNDLPSSPIKSTKTGGLGSKSGYIDAQNFKNQYIEPVRTQTAKNKDSKTQRPRVSKTQRRSVQSNGSKEFSTNINLNKMLPQISNFDRPKTPKKLLKKREKTPTTQKQQHESMPVNQIVVPVKLVRTASQLRRIVQVEKDLKLKNKRKNGAEKLKEWKHQQRLLDAEEKIEEMKFGYPDEDELKRKQAILKIYKSKQKEPTLTTTSIKAQNDRYQEAKKNLIDQQKELQSKQAQMEIQNRSLDLEMKLKEQQRVIALQQVQSLEHQRVATLQQKKIINQQLVQEASNKKVNQLVHERNLGNINVPYIPSIKISDIHLDIDSPQISPQGPISMLSPQTAPQGIQGSGMDMRVIKKQQHEQAIRINDLELKRENEQMQEAINRKEKSVERLLKQRERSGSKQPGSQAGSADKVQYISNLTSPKQEHFESSQIYPSPMPEKYADYKNQGQVRIRDYSQNSFQMGQELDMNADDVDEMNESEKLSSAQTTPKPVRKLLDPVLRKSEPNISNIRAPPGKLLTRNLMNNIATTDTKSRAKKSIIPNKSPFKQGTKASRTGSQVSIGLNSKKSSTSAKPRFN